MEPRLDVMETGLERYAFCDEYYARQGSFSSPRKHYSTHHIPSFSASQPSLYQANNRVHTVRREEIFIKNHRQESFNKLEPRFAFMQDDNYGRQDWSDEAADEKQGRKWSRIRDGGSQNPSSPQRHHGFVQEGFNKQQEARYFRSQPEQPYTYQDNNYGRQDWNHEAGSSVDEKQGIRKWSSIRAAAAAASQNSSSPQRYGFVQEAGAKQQEARYFCSQPEQPYTYQVRPGSVDEEMEVMDAFEAVRRHGGLLVIDYSKRK